MSTTTDVSCAYLPIPPRVWSRTQAACTYTVPGSTYSSYYLPLINKTVSPGEAIEDAKQMYKGNVLQYKGNSSQLSRAQRYSAIARGAWSSRTKVFATQSQIYSNPNTTSMVRVGYVEYPFPNNIVGAPNNLAGPFAAPIPNPSGCTLPKYRVQDGGTLVCGSRANPCTGATLSEVSGDGTVCFPAAASNVPGPGVLCWNRRIQTYFPRQPGMYMSNSGTKWPVGYKGFVSALHYN